MVRGKNVSIENEHGIFIYHYSPVNIHSESLNLLYLFFTEISRPNHVKYTFVCSKDILEYLNKNNVLENLDTKKHKVISYNDTNMFAFFSRLFLDALLQKLEQNSFSYFKKSNKGIFHFIMKRILKPCLYFIYICLILIKNLFYVLRKLILSLLPNEFRMLLVKVKNFLVKSSLKLISRISIKIKIYTIIKKNISLIQTLNKLNDIQAWYTPFSVFLDFNKINKPILLSLFDFVFDDFRFSEATDTHGGVIMNSTFNAFNLKKCKHIIVYNKMTMYETLINKLSISDKNISFISPAQRNLHAHIQVNGLQDNAAATLSFCKNTLMNAFKNCDNSAYIRNFENSEFTFLFCQYLSSANSNIFNLLKAYQFLLREKYFGYKLIISANTKIYDQCYNFLIAHRLINDIIFVHSLTLQEQAACYKLAHLSINTSFNEDSFFSIFTNSLSLDTPVVSSRNFTAEDILHTSALKKLTLFDPHDSQDIAYCIENAIKNRQQILDLQLPLYHQLQKRTASDCINDHIKLLHEMQNPSDTSALSYIHAHQEEVLPETV